MPGMEREYIFEWLLQAEYKNIFMKQMTKTMSAMVKCTAAVHVARMLKRSTELDPNKNLLFYPRIKCCLQGLFLNVLLDWSSLVIVYVKIYDHSFSCFLKKKNI